MLVDSFVRQHAEVSFQSVRGLLDTRIGREPVYVGKCVLDVPYGFPERRMGKNPSSFPRDGFFNEKQKVFFFPFVEQSRKGFRIGKY